MCGDGEGIHALALGAAARVSRAARKNLVLATAAAAAATAGSAGGDKGGCGGEGDGGGDGGDGGDGGSVRAGPSVMRVSYITVTPDVDQSSNRGYR